jgi:hypothetical protein
MKFPFCERLPSGDPLGISDQGKISRDIVEACPRNLDVLGELSHYPAIEGAVRWRWDLLKTPEIF